MSVRQRSRGEGVRTFCMTPIHSRTKTGAKSVAGRNWYILSAGDILVGKLKEVLIGRNHESVNIVRMAVVKGYDP